MNINSGLAEIDNARQDPETRKVWRFIAESLHRCSFPCFNQWLCIVRSCSRFHCISADLCGCLSEPSRSRSMCLTFQEPQSGIQFSFLLKLVHRTSPALGTNSVDVVNSEEMSFFMLQMTTGNRFWEVVWHVLMVHEGPSLLVSLEQSFTRSHSCLQFH